MAARKRQSAKRRKSTPKRPAGLPYPKVWHRGFVSRAQAAKFKRTPKLRKYVRGMTYDVPPKGDGNAKSKIARLPYKVGRRTKRGRRR